MTSSAEQEERSSQDGGDECSSLTEQGGTTDSAKRVYPQDHPGTEDRTVPLQLERSFHSDLSFTGYSNSSFTEGVGNSFNVKTRFSFSQPRYKSCSLSQKELPVTLQTKTLPSTLFAWDDLPFSESLTEFLDKDLNALDKTPNLNLQHPKQTAGTLVEISDLSAEPASVCLRTKEIISKDKLHDITKATTLGSGGGSALPDQDFKNSCERMNRYERRRITWDGEVFLSSKKQEKHDDVDGYNCSADLFSDSLIHTETNKDHAQTLRSPLDVSFQLADMNDQQLKNESSRMSHSTPQKQILKSNHQCIKRDSIDLLGFDFVPPSQSTPVMKICALTDSPGINACSSLKDDSSKDNVMLEIRTSRCKKKIPTGRSFSKPDKNTDRHPVGQHATLQRGTCSCDSPTSNCHKDDFEAGNVTVCDYEDGEGVVGPTPAHKMRLSVTLRKKWQMENARKDSGCKRKESLGDEGNCSRLPWNWTQSVFYAKETVGGRCLDGTRDDLAEDGEQTCDWSKDLFSDSI